MSESVRMPKMKKNYKSLHIIYWKLVLNNNFI